MKQNYYAIEESCQISGLQYIYQGYFGRKADGIFVEVGAYDGRTWSNTYPLACLGWRGLYIEPVEEFYQRCRGNHKKHPNVRIIQAAVSDKEESAKMYQSRGLFTLSDVLLSIRADADTQYKMINTTTLRSILMMNDWPRSYDLLVVDTEGFDLQVLKGADIPYYTPDMVIIEAHEFHEDDAMTVFAKEINTFLAFYGYSKIYADMINSVFIH